MTSPAPWPKPCKKAAQSCDAVLTSGGVSVGDRDFVKLGPGEARRPTGPLVAGGGEAGKTVRLFYLAPSTGRPFSASPATPSPPSFPTRCSPAQSLRLMAGHAHLDRPAWLAIAEVALPRQPDGRLHLARVVCPRPGRRLVGVRPSGGQASHQLRALADANALAFLARRLRRGRRRKRRGHGPRPRRLFAVAD